LSLVLNLGCGTRPSADADVVNIDWSPYLRIAQNRLARRIARVALDPQRAERLKRLPPNVVVHDLRKGIPFPDASVDVVYHSHLLEHIDREVAPRFQLEVLRVLRPGGLQRIVVPDLEQLCRNLILDLERGDDGKRHDELIAELLEQSVRREARGTSQKGPARRMIENIVLGDARKRGETHQWMYDASNLAALLEESNFTNISVRSFDESQIPDWQKYGLDANLDGSPYKPGSLYVEAEAPPASAA
jgi:predicted SAM-dependent methyltransferase